MSDPVDREALDDAAHRRFMETRRRGQGRKLAPMTPPNVVDLDAAPVHTDTEES